MFQIRSKFLLFSSEALNFLLGRRREESPTGPYGFLASAAPIPMKPESKLFFAIPISCALALSSSAFGDVIWKDNNTGNLNLVTSWLTTEDGKKNPKTNDFNKTSNTLRFGGSGQAASMTSLNLGGDFAVGALRLDNGTGTPNYDVTIASGNTLTLNGNTDYTTGTVHGIVLASVTGGLLTVNANIAVAANQQWIAARNLNVGGNVALGANTLSIVANGGTTAISGVISGTNGKLVKDSAGTLTLSATNTYTGGTTVNDGVLDLTGGGGATGTIRGTATVNSGGILRLSTNNATGTNTDSTRLSVINLVGGTLDVNTPSGNNNQTLTNLVINMTGGKITSAGGNNLDFFGGASALNTLASATTSTISGVDLSVLRQGDTTFTVAKGSTSNGIDLDIQGGIRNSGSESALGGQFIKAGAGTLALSGNNTISTANSNSIRIDAGTLMIGNGVTTGNVGNVNGLSITNNATLTFNHLGGFAFTSVISGTGMVNHIGSGITGLTGDNSYKGATSITNGTLRINGDSSAATGAGTVASGGTLGGWGTVGGATTVSGTHNVDLDTDSHTDRTQNFSSSLKYNTGSIFNWDLDAGATDTGSGALNSGTYDQVIAAGAVTKDGGTGAIFKIVLGGTDAFTDAFWNTSKSWSNIFSTGSGSDSLATIFTSFDGSDITNSGVVAGQGQFTFSGNTLNWSAVPEPSSALAGLLVAAGLLRRRRDAVAQG